MAKSKMDPVHMLQESYDEGTQAFNMQLKNLEIGIELNAEDGDSVLTQPQMLELKVEAGDIIECSKFSKICALGASPMIKAIMSDNMEIELFSLPEKAIIPICIPKIKVMSACYIILQS